MLHKSKELLLDEELLLMHGLLLLLYSMLLLLHSQLLSLELILPCLNCANIVVVSCAWRA